MAGPYYESLASADREIQWKQIGAAVLWIAFAIQALLLVVEVRRPPQHVDVTGVAGLPAERVASVTPDLFNALGLAREAAEKLFRLNASTIAEDRAWVLNRMVPELAAACEKELVGRELEVTRKANGGITARVVSVTPIHEELPYRIEVGVRKEYRGDYVPPEGDGRPVAGDPRQREFRYEFTLVRTARSAMNRDGLLILSWPTQVTQRSGEES